MGRALAAVLAMPLLWAGCSRSPLDGTGGVPCTPAARIDSGDSDVILAAVDDTYVYWFRTGQSRALRAAPRCGGSAPFTVTTESAYRSIATYGERVFFLDGAGAIASVPREGGTATAFASAGASALAAARGTLYWLATDGFHAASLSSIEGPGPTPLGPSNFAALGAASGFVVAGAPGDRLAWIAAGSGGSTGGLMEMPTTGGAPSTLVAGDAPEGRPLGALLASSGDLYFTRLGGGIASVPAAGGSATVIAPLVGADTLAATPAWVWFTGGDSAEPNLSRAPRSGGGVPEVVDSPAALWPIADGAGVWVTDGSAIRFVAD